MAKSLQDQLMGSGLINKNKAKAIQKEKREKRKQAPKGHVEIAEEQRLIEKIRLEKIEKDKELNKQRVAEQEKKAIRAQVKQLLLSNKIQREKGEIPFQFTHDKKIKKIYVSELQFTHLSKGLLAIGSVEDDYIIVPAGVAKKIIERDPSAIHYYFVKQETEDHNSEEEDPYKGFEIPDDLMW